MTISYSLLKISFHLELFLCVSLCLCVCAFVAVAFGIGRIKKSYETSLRFCAIDAPKRKTGANIKWDEKNGPNARKWEKKDKVQQQRDDKSENEKGRWKKGQKMNCIMKSLRVISRTALLLGHQFHTIFAHIFLNINWELLLQILFVVSTFFSFSIIPAYSFFYL